MAIRWLCVAIPVAILSAPSFMWEGYFRAVATMCLILLAWDTSKAKGE